MKNDSELSSQKAEEPQPEMKASQNKAANQGERTGEPQTHRPQATPSGNPRKPIFKEPGFVAATVLVVLALVLLTVWATSGGVAGSQTSQTTPSATNPLAAPQILAEIPTVVPISLPTQKATPQPTIAPTLVPRTEVITYKINEGDSIYTIADKSGLSPETIFWANYYELGEDPRLFIAGTEIFILPVDGTYHKWIEGEGLNGVSEFYGVSPDDIIDYPLNHLDRSTLGNLSSPNIQPGTRLVVPGGTRPVALSADGLLTYAAYKQLNSLPIGTPETFPAPRTQLITYVIQSQDSLFTIAEKFDLTPETVLWSNRYLIGDTPDGIYEGKKLIILPANGVIHGWSTGENLDKVASFYKVSRDAILNEPLNHIEPSQLADPSHPSIRPGTMLFVPGGTRPPATWVTPVSADDNGVGSHPNVSYLGNFACNSTATAIGSGAWQFPTSEHWISGYEFTPPTHNGLDYAGRMGFEIYATDSGVIIYSGWSSRGYGNTIVVDHGNGYLSLYGHLMDNGMIQQCGSVVSAGQLIGYMGSTGNSSGPHLHFELRFDGSVVNPHDLGL